MEVSKCRAGRGWASAAAQKRPNRHKSARRKELGLPIQAGFVRWADQGVKCCSRKELCWPVYAVRGAGSLLPAAAWDRHAKRDGHSLSAERIDATGSFGRP